jgi:CheY-like chemotaxis protein
MSEETMRKLLVVDDEPEAVELLHDYLSMEGYDVAKAENATIALEYLENNEVEVMITDIRMPGMSGVELTRKVKATKPRIGVIINTAYMGLYDEEDIRKSGADDFLQKPFNLNELKERVEQVLFQMDSLKREG